MGPCLEKINSGNLRRENGDKIGSRTDALDGLLAVLEERHEPALSKQ